MTKREIISKLNTNNARLIKCNTETNEQFDYGSLDNETIYQILKGYEFDEDYEVFSRKNSKI